MSRGGLRSLQRLHRPIKLVPADQYDPRSRMVSPILETILGFTLIAGLFTRVSAVLAGRSCCCSRWQ